MNAKGRTLPYWRVIKIATTNQGSKNIDGAKYRNNTPERPNH